VSTKAGELHGADLRDVGLLGIYAVFVAGAYALMLDGYVEDQGMQPARTLPIAIPLLAIGIGVSIAAWRKAARP